MKTGNLSKAELDVMTVLWRIGSGSVADVQRELTASGVAHENYAYTTVATLLKRMVQKQAVSSRKVDRSYVFEPIEALSDFQKVRLSDMVRQLFDGRPSSLASQFIATNSFSQEELDALRKLIDEKNPD